MAKRHLDNIQSVSITAENPQLLFPAINDNFDRKDLNICSIKYAQEHSNCKIAKEFWQKFRHSQKIIIIDDYFYKIPIKYISEYLKEEAQLVIYTGRGTNELKKNLKMIENKNITLYKTGKSLKIHDRYAILDNELFHFGSTVGGFEEHFTTYTRGWEFEKIKGLLDYLESKECLQYHLITKESL